MIIRLIILIFIHSLNSSKNNLTLWLELLPPISVLWFSLALSNGVI
jgi:hypothetical protein